MSVEKTNSLIKRWAHARKNVDKLKREINTAEQELLNAQNELGKWLQPEGVKIEGPFHIWFGSGVMSSTRISDSDYKVEWLKKPDGKDAYEYDN